MPELAELIDGYFPPVRALPPTPAPVAKPAPASTAPPTIAVARTTAQPTAANTSRTLQLANPAAATHPGTAAKAVAPTGGYWWHQTAPPPSQANKVNTKPKAITNRPLEQSNAKKTATPANKIAEPIGGYEPGNTHPASALGKPVRLGPGRAPLPASKGRPPDEWLTDRNKPKTVAARRRTTAATASPAATFNQLLASELPRTKFPTSRVSDNRKTAFGNAAKSKRFSPQGIPVFGLPPKNERPPIKPGHPTVLDGLEEIHNRVVSVKAADIKAIAELPDDFIRSLKYLLEHPTALIEAAIEFHFHRNKEASIVEKALTAKRAGASYGTAILQAGKQFASQYASDKIHELEDEAVRVLLRLGLGKMAGDVATWLFSAVTTALTAAAVAATIGEALEFKQDYPGALNHPTGKHFLLNLETIVEPKTELTHVTMLVPSRSSAPQTAFRPYVGGGFGVSRYAAEASRPEIPVSLPVIGEGVDIDLKAFIYWWASR